jgi:hypothetical protein
MILFYILVPIHGYVLSFLCVFAFGWNYNIEIIIKTREILSKTSTAHNCLLLNSNYVASIIFHNFLSDAVYFPLYCGMKMYIWSRDTFQL